MDKKLIERRRKQNEWIKAYRLTDKGKAVYKNYYERNKSKINNRNKNHKQLNFKTFISKLLTHCKWHEKKKKRQVNLDMDYLLNMLENQNYCCAITGVKMAHEVGNIRSVSIDRIDNTKGHLKGNIQLVCQGYQFLKNDWTDSEAVDLLTEVVEIANGKNEIKVKVI